MVERSHRSNPLVRAALNALLAIGLAGVGAASAALPQVDRTPVKYTAQDGTGAVWGAAPSEIGGLYRWDSDHWAHPQVPVPPGVAPLAVWNGIRGGVVVLWQMSHDGAALTLCRGNGCNRIGELDDTLGAVHLFNSARDTLWMTANSPDIYRLVGGRMRSVYAFSPAQFFSYTHPPGEPAFYCPFEAVEDTQGRTWFWGNAIGQYSNLAPLEGFVIYDGHSFTYHRNLAGLPDAGVSFLGPEDSTHLWAGMLRKGLYSIDTTTLTAKRIPDPELNAFRRVTKVFTVEGDTYVVTDPYATAVAETPEHIFSCVLWRLRNGQWEKVLAGIDDVPERTEDSVRPWLREPGGLWLGSHAAGLWFIPGAGSRPQLVNWRQDLPLNSVDCLYSLPGGRVLAVDLRSSRSVAFEPRQVLSATRAAQSIRVINPYSLLQTDQQFRIWGIRSLRERTLDEWDGERWTAHPLPGNLAPSWLSGLDADADGRIWLFPGCQMGPIAILEPRTGAWTSFPSYEAALENWRNPPVRFLHAGEDRMKPMYGPRRQIAYMGACNGINYFDGSQWRLWNRRDVPGDLRHFFDGPAFFDGGGRLAIDIHHETWELGSEAGWHAVSYEPERDRLVRWFTPGPASPPPLGCPEIQSTSLARDRLGRAWWTWRGNVYIGVSGTCRLVLSSKEPQPFIDGRRLRRVLIDRLGNAFFETLLVPRNVGEYVVLPASGRFPQTRISLNKISADSFQVAFSTTALGKPLYTWKIDTGEWSSPQVQNKVVLRAIPAGEHTIEADAIEPDLRMNPIPASAELDVGVRPQEQVAELVTRLLRAKGDNQRAAAVGALVRQPAQRVLPALRAARAKASTDQQWWIDAAIQQIKQSPRGGQ